MTTEALGVLDIFSTLTPEEMARVRRSMERQDVPGGWVLFCEGDEGRTMYVVLSGEVAISIHTDDGSEVEVSRVGEGSFFGEMSILEKDRRSATCKTTEDCVLLSLDADAFAGLIESEPGAATKVMNRMLHTATSRLQNTGAFLSDMVRWGENARIRAITDEFTGLYNRRFFDGALKDAIRDANMSNEAMSLVMLDLDRFGTLNAEYGEAVGDEVIQAVVPAFVGAFAETDILARYGGDEFAFILPRTDGQDALERCRRAGAAIRQLPVFDGKEGSFRNITASIGIAVCPRDGETARELLDRADAALYRAKEAGRDRAVLFGDGGTDEEGSHTESPNQATSD